VAASYRGMPKSGGFGYTSAKSIFFGTRRFGKNVRFGGRDIIRPTLVPVNPKAFEALEMPVTNPGAWRRREKIAINKLLYAAGYEIREVLYGILSNSREASSFGVPGIASNTAYTRMLKAAGSPALRDSGSLLDSLRVRVPTEGSRRIEIDFNAAPGNSLKGSARGTTPAGQVAYMLEFGHTITVTPRMRKFMVAKARALGAPVRAKKVGSTIRVMARPFLRPGVRSGLRRFEQKYTQGGGAARILFDMYFGVKAHSDPVVQFSSNNGITQPPNFVGL
jgi:hypothetical protein